MSTNAQIEANRQNSLASTGPVTEEGKQISSQNAVRHGFTGQNLILSAEEKVPYEAHVQAFLAHYQPANALETNLAQQLADAHWSLHQIFVQQSNLFSLMNATTSNWPPGTMPSPPPLLCSLSPARSTPSGSMNSAVAASPPRSKSSSKPPFRLARMTKNATSTKPPSSI
jgi:hypothetical protein